MNNYLGKVEITKDIVSFFSERYVICIQDREDIYKIFQIIFVKNGGIFINFPYYFKKEGLVSLVTFAGNIKQPTDLSLLPGGKVTTNLVKYSHHPDGNAHFSQSGKVFTAIRKKSVPLSEINGHLFTIQFQGIKDFKKHNPEKDSKKSYLTRKNIFLKLDGPEPNSIKIVGRLYTKEYFQSLLNKPNEEPQIFYEFEKNIYKAAIVLCPPPNSGYGNYVLTITYDEIQKVSKEEYSCLTFIAGFDPKTITRNHSLDTTFLSFIYPMEGIEELKNKIGCLDYRSNSDI